MQPFATTLATAEAGTAFCRDQLVTAKRWLAQILAVDAARTEANTLQPYNALLIAVSNAAATAGLYSETHPLEAVREAARISEQEISSFATELALHRELYEALAAVDLRTAAPTTKRFVEHTLRDYRRSGIELEAPARERLRQIEDELTLLSQAFSKNISEDVRTLEVPPTRLAGLPADFLARHPLTANGTVVLTTDYPDYMPVMTYAIDDNVRRELYLLFRSRALANEVVLQQLLELRAEKAHLLGYANYADYVTADKMIGSGENAASFIAQIRTLAKPRADADYQELLAQLRQHQPAATQVDDWQKAWLENEVKKARYSVDSAEVRAYFPYERVVEGLLTLTGELFELRYEPVPEAPRWHDSIAVYDVWRVDRRIGRIYLDMHPREGKYKHAAQFTLRDGVRGTQLPEGVLVCNFPAPDPLAGPTLLEHDDVVTMFHEFGHLMHHILGGDQAWVRQSGVATEMDFVEVPSQLFEEWAWNAATLARFAKHHEHGTPIPAELVARMRNADTFGLGTQTLQQMFYAAISLRFHQLPPHTLQPREEVRELQNRYTPFAYVEDTAFHASFGHLVGYSAMYYTYMWSKVIAKDVCSAFDQADFMAVAVARRYRDLILAKGGTENAADMVAAFLGRPYEFTAFERYLDGA